MGSVEPGGFYEIRLDRLKPSELDEAGIAAVFGCGARLIATCRPLPDGAGAVTDADRLEILQRAIMSGAAYVDIELEAPEAYRKTLLAAAKSHKCLAILSHHDYAQTQTRSVLIDVYQRGKDMGADLVKIACRVNAPDDGARLLGLLDGRPDLVVVGMGLLGRIVRIASPLLGSPFTFTAPDQGPLTAPGQIRAGELEKLLQSMQNLSS